MSAVPLLESKLHVPRRRRAVVPRDRLDRRLDGADAAAVVVVSAPAGFGKTTLLAEWLSAGDGDRPTAWVSLDRRDGDPAVFWSYVLAALERARPGAGAGGQAALASSAPLEAVVTALVNDLAALDGDVALVLDDYHLVESLDVHESMRFLLEHLPARLRLVVASRADPPWPLAGLRARGELLEVRAADLRFTAGEAAAYLNDAMGLDLSEHQVAALEGRTEGWIAALQLAALSLRDRDDPAAFLEEFAGDDRFVVDYLVDEVLDRQPDDVRDFLLDTSILSRLSGPLCAAVTGRDDARRTLDALDRDNLFLVPLDDRRRWFRYHHLFADVLRSRLVDERPELVDDLHRRAAAWFEAEGDRPEAIRHALAAGEVAKAAELIELAVPDLRQVRQDATLRRMLDALPAEVFADRPVLNLAMVGARMVTGDVAGVAQRLDAIEAWLEPDRSTAAMVVHDRAELERLPAQAAMYRAALALLGGDLAATVGHGQRAASLSAADDHLGRGAAEALIGLAAWTAGDLEAATGRYRDAIAAFVRVDHLADVLGCSLGLADMQVALGRLGVAERTLAAGLELAAAHGPLRGTPDLHVGLAEVHLERNELDRAEERLRASLELGEALALPQHAYRWRVVRARLDAIAGDHAGALGLLAEAERCYATDYSPPVRPVAATAVPVRLGAGDVAGARRWADEAGLSAGDDPSYLREHEHLALVWILLAEGRCHEAIDLAERLRAAADAGGRHGRAAEAQVLVALGLELADDRPAALVALADALARAEPEGHRRMFLDAGPPMTALLEAAVRHGRGEAPAQAAALLSGAPAPTAAASVSTPSAPATAAIGVDRPGSGNGRRAEPGHRPPPALIDPLSSRELDVLRLLRSDLSGPEIAAELIVSLNTVRTHTRNIFTKLGVNSRRAAVRRADELGL
jgi:LuxR family maltose regulon positive regulatory protein